MIKTLFNKNVGYQKINFINDNYNIQSFHQKKLIKITKIPLIFIPLIIMIILIIFVLYLLVFNNNNKNLPQSEDKNKIKNYLNLNLSYITQNYTIKKILPDELKSYLEYMDKAKLGILLNKQNLIKSENPKVSIIISLFNRKEYINSTIRSIQNKNLSEIEIIIINDFY